MCSSYRGELTIRSWELKNCGRSTQTDFDRLGLIFQGETIKWLPHSLSKLSTDVTHLSIGLIIKGIALSPTIVVIHIWALGGTPLAYLLRVNLDAAQILLIVNPGMITEANPCQMAASTMVSTALRF